jgi:HSP20 family protein
MNMVKWDPFRELEDVSTRLNRVFGRPLIRSESGKEMLAVA